ncbi:hypothetical protein SEA_MAGRITTE_214 [Microbacterium phage Magritte]|nr:hypothetical protein SEA_MAGRITTE_214 [Microbacterium phage Magritte]
MLDISKNEFLASMNDKIRSEEITDIRDALEQVWVQAGEQAVLDAEIRRMQHDLGQAIMLSGGPEAVAERAGVSADTIKRWAVRPMEMTLGELRRLQLATGTSLHLEVLAPIDKEN